jgi:hypothetical protein
VSTYAILVLAGVVLTLPRIQDKWFMYSLFAYPMFSIIMLELLRRMTAWLARIQEFGERLGIGDCAKATVVSAEESRVRRWICALVIGMLLAGASLAINRNPHWSRYSEALAVFYVGSMAGELAYQLLLVPQLFSRLKRRSLRLNPFDPANTVAMRGLAEVTLVTGVATACGLFVINVTLALAGYYYHHLLVGVIVISVIAWTTTASVMVYPHVALSEIVQRAKASTLAEIEEQLIRFDYSILKNSRGLEDAKRLLDLQAHLLGTSNYPFRNTATFGMVSAVLLNSVPAIIGWMRQH